MNGSHPITNAFEGNVVIIPAWHQTTMDEKHLNAFMIGIDGLPKSACITLATTDWGGDTG